MGNEVIFQVLDRDPLEHRADRDSVPSPASSDNEEPAVTTGLQATEQEDSTPEIQQTQEQDVNAPSAKVIGACQPHDD